MHRRATTIMEILVVLGTLGVLFAVGSSAMHTVGTEARATECGANLRQLGVASQGYRNQNLGALPAAVLYKVRGSELLTCAWDYTSTQSGGMEPGILWQFAGGPTKVLQCPEHLAVGDRADGPFTGYNYNTTYLGAEGRLPHLDEAGTLVEGWNAARKGVPPALHRTPDRCALFGDAGWRGGANKFMRAPSNTVERDLGMVYAGGQAFRHLDCCAVVHLDGHCARYTQARPGTHALPWLLRDVMGHPENGFLDDEDGPYDPSQ